MTTAANLQRQHRKLQGMGLELIKLAARPSLDAAEVRRALARFSGTLRMHATMEEEVLYPDLLSSPDAEVKAVASRLHGELEGLYTRWDEFMERWRDAEAILAHPYRFRLDLTRVLTTLGRRMKKEDRQLYPLVARHDLTFARR